MALAHSALMGAVAGSRAMTPLAAVAAAIRARRLPVEDGWPSILRAPLILETAVAIALGELVGDKMKTAPNRTVLAGMVARIATGALAGAVLVPRRQRALASAVGAVTAVASAHLTFEIRSTAMRRYGQTATGIVEDLVAVCAAATICVSAARW